MDTFMKATAGVLIALVLYLVLAKQTKDISLLLSVAVCSMICLAAITYLKPVIEFFKKLEALGQLEPQMLEIILKAVGIALLSEISGLICTDAGNAALGKSLQILASAVILWMSVPLFTNLLTLVEQILVLL